MNITVVYGTENRGSTYNIAQEVIKSIHNPDVEEIFLPRDLPTFCLGCKRCFNEEKGTCAHSKYTVPIREKLLWADLIILTSPVYSYHVSGQMKVFLDHFANMWMVHRPEGEMFTKQGIVITTAAGPVYKKTLNEMKDSLDFWGVAKVYKIGGVSGGVDWESAPDKNKERFIKKSRAIADRIQNRNGDLKPSFRVRKWFYLSRFMQMKIKSNPPDVDYWNEKGWTKKVRPWHNE